MLNPQKKLERETLLRRHRELEAEIAQHERNLRDCARAGGINDSARDVVVDAVDRCSPVRVADY